MSRDVSGFMRVSGPQAHRREKEGFVLESEFPVLLQRMAQSAPKLWFPVNDFSQLLVGSCPS